MILNALSMSKSAPLLLSSYLVLALALVGCDKTQVEPAPAPAAPAAPVIQAEVPSTQATPSPSQKVTTTDIVWTAPSGWTKMPDRMMRKATYQAEGKKGPAEVAVFYFGPGQGGAVEANIDRWVGQFQNLPEGAAKRSETEQNGFKRFNVDVDKGTFASGMPGGPTGPQNDWAMSASIVQTANNPVDYYYFKMTGPAATVAEQKANFSLLLSSVRRAQSP